MPTPSGVSWYVHMHDETLGPLTTEKVVLMLTQNRLQFADFAWSEGYTKWVRISDIDEFAAHLPGYPKIGIPKKSVAAPVSEAEPEDEPVVEAKPGRKAA